MGAGAEEGVTARAPLCTIWVSPCGVPQSKVTERSGEDPAPLPVPIRASPALGQDTAPPSTLAAFTAGLDGEGSGLGARLEKGVTGCPSIP